MNSAADAGVLDLIEKASTRFYGKYPGTVTEVDEDTMRLKAKVPDVLGEQATGWAVACVPYAGNGYGIAFLPEEGCGVWIEFQAGDVSRPIWSGCYWREGEKPSDATGKVKVIQTKEGAKIVLDDDAKSITITDSHENEIKIDDGGIKLSRGSMSVEITDSAVKVNDGSLEVT